MKEAETWPVRPDEEHIYYPGTTREPPPGARTWELTAEEVFNALAEYVHGRARLRGRWAGTSHVRTVAERRGGGEATGEIAAQVTLWRLSEEELARGTVSAPEHEAPTE